nr:hypothetical protein 6 [Pseudomonadaceae bacterium]
MSESQTIPSNSGANEIAVSLATDPLRFVAMCWPDMQLFDKQREILLSVRDNVETFVHAANETGKTRTAALVTIWFFASRTPARVVTSSSSETQLNSILWSEIHHLISTSKLHLPFVTKHLSVKKRRSLEGMETEPLDYIIGYVTNQVENFQGHHLSNDKPRVLAVFDEASGVSDEFCDAADSWAHRKLVIGNPLSANFFCRLCKGGDVPDPAGEAALLRKVIHVDGRDSPNVQIGMRWREEGKPGAPPVLISGLLTYTEYLRREQEWDEVKRTTRLHGRFHEGDQTMLFPMAWLDAAMDPTRWEQLQQELRPALALGVDVASGGRDKTCWTLVDGNGVIDQIVMDIGNTMEIVGRTIRLINEHKIPPRRVAIDAGGGGKQITDRLREQRYAVRMVNFGESADVKQAYRNRRAELYGDLRQRLDPGRDEQPFALPPDAHELRQELLVLPLQYDSEGRLVLPPKERRSGTTTERSLRDLLGRSPDRADSLVLAVWALRQPYRDHTHWFRSADVSKEPFTKEEIENLSPFLRGIVEFSQRRIREAEDEGRGRRRRRHGVEWTVDWP